MPLGDSRTRHLLALLPFVAGAIFVWWQRRRRSGSPSSIALDASKPMSIEQFVPEDNARVDEGECSANIHPTASTEDRKEDGVDGEDADGDFSREEKGDSAADDGGGEEDFATFADFAKQRVIDWAEEQVFLDDVVELEKDLLDSFIGGAGGGVGDFGGSVPMQRCSTLVSYSEVDEASWTDGGPSSTKESAYSSLQTTPKTEKGKSPRNRKPKRRSYSACVVETCSGNNNNNNNHRSLREIDADNWRDHMDRYRVDDGGGVVALEGEGVSRSSSGSPGNDISSVVSHDSGFGRNGDRTGRDDNEDGGFGGGGDYDDDEEVLYEFSFPSELCGLLIGRGGRNLQQLMELSSTTVTLRKQPFEEGKQIVSAVGGHRHVQRLLRLVRERFPKHRYPDLDLRPVAIPLPPDVDVPAILTLALEEGVSNRVLVSAIVSPTHLFLQLPANDTFADLLRLDACMLACYSQVVAPLLPLTLQPGVLCAAAHENGWYRAQLVEVLPDASAPSFSSSPSHLLAVVRFVDYGGYSTLPVSHLRQIRSDFLALPFQAIECILSGVEAVVSSSATATAAADDDVLRGALCLDRLVRGKQVRAEVAAYEQVGGIPLVDLYASDAAGNEDDRPPEVFLNRALIEEGVCRLIDYDAMDGDSPSVAYLDGQVDRLNVGLDRGRDAEQEEEEENSSDFTTTAEMVMNSLLTRIELLEC